MRQLILQLRNFLDNLRGMKSREIKFLLGQSAIIASRGNSASFQDLWDSEVKIYSQFGEDGIIDYICEDLGLSKPSILEIGAGNFGECNSRWLVESRNSGAYLVDSRGDLPAGIRQSQLLWKSHLFFEQSWVTPENVQALFDRATNAMDRVDIFSLDLDGNDYWILKELNLKSTKVVIVEYNPLFGHNLGVSIPRDDTFVRSEGHHSWLYYGASLIAFIDLLETKGFSFIGTNRVGNNAFFVSRGISDSLHLLARNDLSKYTDWPIRDSRSAKGELNYLSGNHRVEEMQEMPLVQISTNLMISVGNLSH